MKQCSRNTYQDLYKLTPRELGRLFPIIISEPMSGWPDLFAEEKGRILALLGAQTAIRIEHIGSTAVPGLAAKPTVDMLVEVPGEEDIKNRIINVMTSNGYYYMHEQTDHLMFVKGYTPQGFKGQSYHIHMGPKDNDGLWDRLYFRDYLRANPLLAREYARLKKQLASRYRYDREAYTQAKTGFIVKATREAIEALKH